METCSLRGFTAAVPGVAVPGYIHGAKFVQIHCPNAVIVGTITACVTDVFMIKRMETDRDHIHMLVQYNPTDSISRIVSTLKQHTTHLARKNHFPMLQYQYWKKKTLWSDGYFAASVGQVSQQTIEHYIENQG